MQRLRNSDIKFLKGVGPTRADLLNKQLGIRTFYDLLHHFPTHYIDRSRTYAISEFAGDMPMVQVRGRFVSFNVVGEGAKTRLTALFSDGRATMEVVWFNRIKWIREAYHTGVEYILFGKPSLFNSTWSMVHPEVDTFNADTPPQGLRGVYPLTDTLRNRGFSSRTFHDLALSLLSTQALILLLLSSFALQKLSNGIIDFRQLNRYLFLRNRMDKFNFMRLKRDASIRVAAL